MTADGYFREGNYELSKEFYGKALKFSPSQVYPKQKIIEIDKILETKKNYFNNLIHDVDSLYEEKEFVLAKEYYLKSYAVDSSYAYPYPKSHISKINKFPNK